jgi:AcrR family transcriptional regulator
LSKSPPRRRLTAQARRELIEQAATELFAEQGYHGTTVGQIARRAGISVPVVYDHFGSKQDLHRRLLEQHFAELRDIWMHHLASGTGSRTEQTGSALEAWFAYVESHPFAWRMLFRDTTGDPAVAAMHAEVAAASRAALLPLMAAELSSRSAPEVEMAWEAIRGAIQALALWWYENPLVARDRVVAAAMNAIWLGLERTGQGEAWTGRETPVIRPGAAP